MNTGSLSILGAVMAVAAGAALLFATGGLLLPVAAAALAVVLLIVGRRLSRAAAAAEDAAEDPRSHGAGEPLRNDTRAVFVGTGAPDDPLRSKSSRSATRG